MQIGDVYNYKSWQVWPHLHIKVLAQLLIMQVPLSEHFRDQAKGNLPVKQNICFQVENVNS